jgi:hypothetical protein
LTRPEVERGQRLFAWPEFLPDGRAVLFTVVPLGTTDPTQIAWLDLETLAVHGLSVPGTSPHYVPTGHIVYAYGTSLMAVGFDLESREIRGEPVALRDTMVATTLDNRAAEFAVSSTGTLAFVPPILPEKLSPQILVWVDRAGNEEVLPIAPGRYNYARVSPDGTRIAIDAGTDSDRDIWIWDTERASLTRLTDGPNETSAIDSIDVSIVLNWFEELRAQVPTR